MNTFILFTNTPGNEFHTSRPKYNIEFRKRICSRLRTWKVNLIPSSIVILYFEDTAMTVFFRELSILSVMNHLCIYLAFNKFNGENITSVESTFFLNVIIRKIAFCALEILFRNDGQAQPHMTMQYIIFE